MDMLWIIVGVMLASGILGGVMNFFIADPETERPLRWWQHVVVGVGAAFMVPLFLNMISSGLIDSIQGNTDKPGDMSKLFVLAGFCLVASVSSRAFISTLSERVLQEVRNAKKKAEQAQVEAAEARAIVEPLVEEEVAPNELATSDLGGDNTDKVELTDDERAVLSAMTRSRFTMRSLSGIAKETGLAKPHVNAMISSLIIKGLVAQGESSSGQPRWYATTAGRTAI